MSTNLHSVIADAEGDMRKVYDLALIIYDQLSKADPISGDMQHALSWPASDLLQAGLALRKRFDAMFDLSTSGCAAPAPAPQIATPIVDPAKLSLEGLHQLHDALKTVFHVVAGLCEQPRFDHKGEAGKALDRLWEWLAGEMQRLTNEAEGRVATTDDERNRQFGLLTACYVDGLTSPAYAIKQITKIAKKIGGAK